MGLRFLFLIVLPCCLLTRGAWSSDFLESRSFSLRSPAPVEQPDGPAPTLAVPAAQASPAWPNCSFQLAAAAARSHRPPALPTEIYPPHGDAALRDARTKFTNQITDGWLLGFEDDDSQAVFRSKQPLDTSHQPGLLEDEVIASAVRSKIAADQELQKLGVRVESQAGKVQLTGALATAATAANLVKLALSVEGVSEVRIDLPTDLRAARDPYGNRGAPE